MRSTVTTQLSNREEHLTCSLVLGMMRARREGRYTFLSKIGTKIDARVQYLYCDARCTEDLEPKLRLARAYLAHKAWEAYEARCARP